MDNSTTQSVKEIFGTDFQQYCLDHKLLLKKDKCDAFIVPNVNALTETTLILDKLKFKVNTRLKKLQKKERNNRQKLYEQYKPNMQKWKKTYTKVTHHNVFLMNLQVEISLYDTSSVLPSFADHKVPINYILNTAKSGNEIYEYIIKETMKDILIVNYEISIPLISSILKQFQKQHKRFHYFSVLKNLTHTQELNENSKYEYATTKKQLKSFFDLVTAKVVPLSMFGKLQNLKKIKKAMFQLLNTPRSKSFNLMPLINKIDISSIMWLKNIENVKIKWLIIAKFVKWFFAGFLLKVLYTYFHVTSASTKTNERLYIMRSNWNSIQRKFIRTKVRLNTLQPDIKCNKWNPPIGVYKLHPKPSSVRPIFMPQCPDNDKHHLNIVFKFLKQLCVTKYGLTNFEEEWKSIVQFKRNLKAKQLYFISCDVVDAFGSIIQEKLYDIIQSLCQNLPEALVLRYYIIKSKIFKDNICYKQYFNDPNLQLPFASGTLYKIIYNFIKKFIEVLCFINLCIWDRFLQLIQKGVPQYNCYFKKLKTQSNVIYDGNTVKDNIVYIGYKINCTTLEVEPNYSKTHLRYLTSFCMKGDLTPLQVFKLRLNNIASLKLSKIILNSTVNSKRTIIKILKELCLRQAKRACILIEALFEDVQKHIEDIFKIIKNNNERFARYIIKIFLKCSEI
ncbi:PREDICTED: telomerase reverse transcriptase-like [Habropoda laboriosa]|uniref:telomerase reverse transcriptase-like n=1 Tax=Habropoda laboriosa TaxID=597456 RepID=UPI00083CE5AD|nr:PREDICTED: telomerase reverse transcriptase-like [Habropoda laboriosa]